jgi:hydrogenase small subunit
VREKRVINIPGCPPHPDWIVGTIAKVLSGTPPVIDILGRPHALFSNTIHSQCFYESGLAAKYCLEERGCKGSRTFANCPAIMWNPLKAGEKGVNWCVGARCPCLGCTQPDFPDGMLPFHAEVDD